MASNRSKKRLWQLETQGGARQSKGNVEGVRGTRYNEATKRVSSGVETNAGRCILRINERMRCTRQRQTLTPYGKPSYMLGADEKATSSVFFPIAEDAATLLWHPVCVNGGSPGERPLVQRAPCGSRRGARPPREGESLPPTSRGWQCERRGRLSDGGTAVNWLLWSFLRFDFRRAKAGKFGGSAVNCLS